MKRTLLALALAIPSLLPLSAFAAPGDELLALQTIDEAGYPEQLATVRQADGTVCQSYVESATRDAQGRLSTVQFQRICGPDHHGSPANLIGLQTVRHGDLVEQIPLLAPGTGS